MPRCTQLLESLVYHLISLTKKKQRPSGRSAHSGLLFEELILLQNWRGGDCLVFFSVASGELSLYLLFQFIKGLNGPSMDCSIHFKTKCILGMVLNNDHNDSVAKQNKISVVVVKLAGPRLACVLRVYKAEEL